MSSGSQTTVQNNAPYASAQPLIDGGLMATRSLWNQGEFRVDPYRGNMVAPRDDFLVRADKMSTNNMTRNTKNLNRAVGGVNRALDPAAAEATKQRVIEGIMPSVNSTFSQAGMTGSDLHQQNLVKGLATGLSEVENQAENRALGAAGMMPGLNNAYTNEIQNWRDVGQDRQDYRQSQINADMLKHQQLETNKVDALRNYLALSTGTGSMFGVQQAQGSNNPGGLGILGAGLQAAPFLAMMSDRRVKEDIKPVGKMFDGTPIYTYRYKGGDTYHMGVMADEVQNPDAVTELPNGLKAVFYGEL